MMLNAHKAEPTAMSNLGARFVDRLFPIATGSTGVIQKMIENARYVLIRDSSHNTFYGTTHGYHIYSVYMWYRYSVYINR